MRPLREIKGDIGKERSKRETTIERSVKEREIEERDLREREIRERSRSGKASESSRKEI